MKPANQFPTLIQSVPSPSLRWLTIWTCALVLLVFAVWGRSRVSEGLMDRSVNFLSRIVPTSRTALAAGPLGEGSVAMLEAISEEESTPADQEEKDVNLASETEPAGPEPLVVDAEGEGGAEVVAATDAEPEPEPALVDTGGEVETEAAIVAESEPELEAESETEQELVKSGFSEAAEESSAAEALDGAPLWLSRPQLSAEDLDEARGAGGIPLLGDLRSAIAAVNRIPVNQELGQLGQGQVLALLRWDLAQRSGAESLTEISATKAGANFLARLGASESWMRELVESGPWLNPEQVLPLLQAIVASQEGIEDDPALRPMASVLALAAAQRGWDQDYVLARFNFFVSRYRSGRLNRRFDTLASWQRRFVAFGVQHGRLNDIDSLAYMNDTVAVPADQYTGACWRSPYRLNNWYGDSIHGSTYYAVFEDAYNSSAEMIEKVGGVCGSLSNFGAGSAVANGIPATTMGEPGHCAYAVMVEPGHFQPAYSLSWKRGVHDPWYGNSWSELRAVEESMADPKQVAESLDMARWARVLQSRDQDRLADGIWRQAIAANPLDQGLWLDYASFGESSKQDRNWWVNFHGAASKTYGPHLGQIAWQLCHRAQQRIFKDGNDPQKRAELILSFHRNLGEDWGYSRWDLAGTINQQLEEVADADTEAKLVAQLVAIHLSKPALAGQAIVAGIDRYQNNEELLQRFLAHVARSASETGGEAGQQALTDLANRVMPAAAKEGDTATWQGIGRFTAGVFEPIDVETEPFSGELLSSGGLLEITGAGNRWDSPVRHWGVLEASGGSFHTDGSPARATITLGSFGELSGIVLVQRTGQHGRVEGATVEVSLDGEDWTEVATVHNQGGVIRIDLGKTKPEARRVRITNREGEPLHMRQILIYGRPLS